MNSLLEDYVLRLLKTIITVVFISALFGSGTPSCQEVSRRDAPEGSAQADPNVDPNDLSAYYGFTEMEVIKLDWQIKDLQIADLTGDGRNDIAIVNNRKAKIELLIQKEKMGPAGASVAVSAEDVDINQIAPPTRFQRQAVAVSQRIHSMVCGDLNSDGIVDLAFYGEPKGLYVMLQKGNSGQAGKLETLQWRPRKKYTVDDGLKSSNGLVCADLNNNGAEDVGLAAKDGVYVLLQEADGSLAEPVKYSTTSVVLGVTAGDINGDNINDLIVITNDNERPLHVRFGLSNGQLGPQVRFFIEKPYALKLRDVDGLPGKEILTVDAVSGRLTCYKFAAEKKEDMDWPTLFYPLTADKESTKRDLAASDFDGDGLVDIAISEPGAAEITFYRQSKGVGFAEPMRFPAFAEIAGLSAADVDGDGRSDLGVLSVKEKIIGVSRFEDGRLSFPQPIDLTGEPLAMELADIDGNGDIDCVYVSWDANDVRHLRVVSYMGNKPRSRPEQPRWAPMGGGLELEKLTSNPDGLKVVDVDVDGLHDVLIFVKYEAPILARQRPEGEFSIVDWPGAQASLIKNASLSSIAVADVDGAAGNELLLAQDNFARSLVFDNGKQWRIVDQYNAKSTENEISAVGAFELDGSATDRPAILLLDGRKGQLQILKAGDDKTYRFSRELDVGRWNSATHLKMLFEPLTGSGANTILLFDSEKFALITPPAETNSVEFLDERFSYETQIKDGGYGNLEAGDINADKRADIIMVEYKRNHMEILALDSQIKPIPAMRFKIFENKSYRKREGRGKYEVEPREVKIADVTGDGKQDLVTVIHDRIIIYPQD
jgi:hypothetical protein